jgi:serine/threonine protein kinase
VNCLDDEHNTPLHYAAMYNHTQIVKILIKHKASPGLKNLKGLYPYDISGSASTAKVFKRYGKRKPAVLISCGYGRIVCDGVIFYNSRVDIVNKLISYANPIPKDSDLNRKQIKKLEKEYPQIIKKFSVEYNEQADLRKAGPEDFDPIGMLGKGSFGEVYLVRERRTQKLYALKLLCKDEIISTNIVRYIFTERNILSSIKHPFIVSLYTSFQTKDKLVLVMDYCPGGDLGSYLVREGKFTEERARIYLCEILLALQELHNNGIIFRDLKPENIVLDTEGHAILTDFGLSKEGVRFGQLQRSFCGSIAYMAPEMLKKKGHDKNVDWYLLGTLLYEMLHGVPPYYCEDQDQLFQNILKAKLTFSNEISSRAVDLLKKLLNRNPAKRLGSGRRDAEEIMEHHFFQGIDWDAVRRRKLKPPPPICYNKKLRKVDNQDIFGKSKRVHEEEDRLIGWSFYNGPAKIV